MKKSAYSLLATAFCLNSCMTYDPYTDEQKVSDSTKGAIIGGVAGAVLGNQVKGSRHVRNNAQIAGATIGALAGASIGNQMGQLPPPKGGGLWSD